MRRFQRKESKDQESIQSNTTPDPGHHKVTKNTRKHHLHESQEVSPLPAGDSHF